MKSEHLQRCLGKYGCLIAGVLNNGHFLLNVSPFWQQVVKGLVILLAVAIDKMNNRDRGS